MTASTYTLTAADNSTDGSNGLPSITADITVTDNGETITRDPAAASFRIFHVAAQGSLTLEYVTLSNGVATGTTSSGDGGAIRNLGTLTINNSTITGSTIINNTAVDDGSGVFSEGSSATTVCAIRRPAPS